MSWAKDSLQARLGRTSGLYRIGGWRTRSVGRQPSGGRAGRFAFHDLLRAYAAEQPTSETGVANTTRRMLDHYLHAAYQAHQVLYPGRELIGLDALVSGVTQEKFSGKASALAWLEAESQVLLKVSGVAALRGYDAHAWRLPADAGAA